MWRTHSFPGKVIYKMVCLPHLCQFFSRRLDPRFLGTRSPYNIYIHLGTAQFTPCGVSWGCPEGLQLDRKENMRRCNNKSATKSVKQSNLWRNKLDSAWMLYPIQNTRIGLCRCIMASCAPLNDHPMRICIMFKRIWNMAGNMTVDKCHTILGYAIWICSKLVSTPG